MDKKIYVVFERYYNCGKFSFEETMAVFDDINIAKEYVEEVSIKEHNELIKDGSSDYRKETLQKIKFKWQDFDNCNFYKPFIGDKIYANFKEYDIIPYELNRKYTNEEIFHGIWGVE